MAGNPTSTRSPDFACRCPIARIWTKRAGGPTTAPRRPAATLAGLQGPAGMELYGQGAASTSPSSTATCGSRPASRPRVREVAILMTAREMDSQFEWFAHETEARKDGVGASVVDAIEHRKSAAGLDATDATVIELARQLWRDHKVSSELFAAAKALFGPISWSSWCC